MQTKKINVLPRRLLWQLILSNVLIIGIFIAASGWAIYNTACFLFGDLSNLPQSQGIFNSSLFHYLLLFSISSITIASIIQFYITKKMLQPLEKLIKSTLKMKSGDFPEPIDVKSNDQIGQLVSNFNELAKQLKENELGRKKLVSDLSHELRTPLSNLNGYLSALKDGVIVGDQALFNSLHDELKRITHLMNQIDKLEEWQMKKDKYTNKIVATPVTTSVNQVLTLFKLELKNKNIDIKTEIEPYSLNINREDMIQIMGNIVQNAISYYHGEEDIFIQGYIHHNFYRLEVTGPSCHISEEDRSHIFERFYRIDPSRNRGTGGSGLGLAISKEIIEQYSGSIGLESNNNLQTFWITIPL